MQAACMSLVFENIKRWFAVNETSKPITKTPKGGRGLKASDDGRVDKTPSPSTKHVSFEITMTQAKQLFVSQLSKLRHQATEQECFEIDTPSYKETDAVHLIEELRMRDVDEALDVHEQEAKVGQGHKGVTPHIRATPHTPKSANMRPRDQFY